MLTILYCITDDFCKLLESSLQQRLLGSEKSKNQCSMSPSEIITIILNYQYSGYKNFKKYYYNEVLKNLKNDFPILVSYTRFIELKQKVFWIMIIFLKVLMGICTGISFSDSSSLKVCHNKRIYNHKVFKNFAQRGKTSIGWFFGFKLHITINHLGEIINFYITPGNVSDNDSSVLNQIMQDVWGKVIVDKGYIGKFKELYERGIQLIHHLRSNMKNQLLPLFDKMLLNKRGIIETVIGILKQDFNLEHTRHRSINGFFINIFSTLIAYAVRPKKPSLKFPDNLCLVG
jgi:hypothetical protein